MVVHRGRRKVAAGRRRAEYIIFAAPSMLTFVSLFFTFFRKTSGWSASGTVISQIMSQYEFLAQFRDCPIKLPGQHICKRGDIPSSTAPVFGLGHDMGHICPICTRTP